jgi:hypothetical protein
MVKKNFSQIFLLQMCVLRKTRGLYHVLVSRCSNFIFGTFFGFLVVLTTPTVLYTYCSNDCSIFFVGVDYSQQNKKFRMDSSHFLGHIPDSREDIFYPF